ncbi:hypothetical protein MKEN_00841700 [Mycena kentingensis (nom. inval.)]|nr:hypothetical protein MKEN_00841700 [Mycena kentingensis (nom. inval.)]
MASASLVALTRLAEDKTLFLMGTAITIQRVEELQSYLQKARKYIVEFQSRDLDEEFDGELRTFTMWFRSVWEWIIELVTDPSLAEHIVWYPQRKYLVVDGVRDRLREDEFYSADLWWEMQDKLPHVPGMHHCIFPLMLWLDEGRITSHTDMYPMLVRALALPAPIRNGSGNGGSFLVGFMPQVKDHGDPKSRTQKQKVERAMHRRRLYHNALRIAFTQELARRSFNGDAVTCGDETARVLFPAVPVKSLDGKEADSLTGTRAAMSHFPCARCLVRADQLHDIFTADREWDARTTASMRGVYEEAREMRFQKHADEHLQAVGLHDVENAFWDMNNSDPYLGASYDLLHSDDLGKFGKHMWPRIQEVLGGLGAGALMTRNMGNVPRWPGLKHFNNVTSKQMNNGQQFLDIEKSLLPCIVQLLPGNSPWIHAIRAHLRYRMMMGLHCITDSQLARKEEYQADYGRWCMKINKRYPEYSFDWPKQHDAYHSTDDVKLKGTASVYCTRVNEGHHQENRDSAKHINFQNNDKQVAEVDATKEAMARIRLIVDMYDKEQAEAADDRAKHAAIPPEVDQSVRRELSAQSEGEEHWRLGARRNLVNSRVALSHAPWIEEDWRRNFDSKLRAFIREVFHDTALRPDGEEQILIRRCDCIHIHYTSEDDYRDAVDLLRCNPEFQANGDERFDIVNVNLDPSTLDFARMLYLFRSEFLCLRPIKYSSRLALPVMDADQTFSQFVPQQGVFAVLTIDPVASLEYLNDEEALEASKDLETKDYVVYVPGTSELRHPDVAFREEDVEFVIPNPIHDVPGRGLDASMCVPIFPETRHPTGRPPLKPSGTFPWPNCYLSPFASSTVRTATVIAIDPILCRLDLEAMVDHEGTNDEDLARYREAMGCDTIITTRAGAATLSAEDPDEFFNFILELFATHKEAPEDKITVNFTHDLTRVKELKNPVDFSSIAEASIARRKAKVDESAAEFDARTAAVQAELRSGASPNFAPDFGQSAAAHWRA